MGSIDGEIPAVWFLISSIGFVILSVIISISKHCNGNNIYELILLTKYSLLSVMKNNYYIKRQLFGRLEKSREVQVQG